MSARGQYAKPGSRMSTVSTAAGLGLAIVGILLAPVIAIVGGAALAAAVGGRGGNR